MNNLGRKIFYHLSTGNVVFTRGEMTGHVIESTTEQDYETYTALADFNPDTIGIILLEYGQYAEDFATCDGYRVNPDTKQLEFSYPDPGESEPDRPPVYRAPLTEQVAELEKENTHLKDALTELAESQEQTYTATQLAPGEISKQSAKVKSNGMGILRID